MDGKILYSINPLKRNPTGKRGKPSKYYKGIHLDYRKYISEGVEHNMLLKLWQVEEYTFQNWLATDIDLAKEVENIKLTNGEEYKTDKIIYSRENLRELSIEGLQDMIMSMNARPHFYKPQERISAYREGLDRTEGKAAQSLTIDSKATITHEYLIKIAPQDAYKRMIEGEFEVVDHAATPTPLVGAEKKKEGGGAPQ